jgi:hypothetical protein
MKCRKSDYSALFIRALYHSTYISAFHYAEKLEIEERFIAFPRRYTSVQVVMETIAPRTKHFTRSLAGSTSLDHRTNYFTRAAEQNNSLEHSHKLLAEKGL